MIDLEAIPRFVILTEGEGFKGESWTTQCEVIQQEMLGGQAPDEKPVPEEIVAGHQAPPFDFFGFGQEESGPIAPNNANNAPDEEQNPTNEQNFNAANRDIWPAVLPALEQINIPQNPKGPQPNGQNLPVVGIMMDIDLSEAVEDPQEVIFHPTQGVEQVAAPDEEGDLVQVNEQEEDNLVEEEQLLPAINNPAQEEIVVALAVLNGPAQNFLA